MGQIIALVAALAIVAALAWWSEQVDADREELSPEARAQWEEHFRNIWG